MIEAGRALVAGLDAQDMGFEAAFWLMDEENGRWHLVLSSRAVKIGGSRALYGDVDRTISALRLNQYIWIGMVSIVGHRTPLLKSLHQALGTPSSVDGTRLDGAFVGGVSIPGCRLYRLSRKQRLSPVSSEAHIS